MMIRFLVFLLLAAAAWAQDPTDRERALQQKLVAVCCWNEPISVHRSETALGMRVELKRLIDEGKSDQEILAWFRAKYTERVLIEPEGTKSAVAYALPAVAALLGLGVVVLVLRRWTKGAEAPA